MDNNKGQPKHAGKETTDRVKKLLADDRKATGRGLCDATPTVPAEPDPIGDEREHTTEGYEPQVPRTLDQDDASVSMSGSAQEFEGAMRFLRNGAPDALFATARNSETGMLVVTPPGVIPERDIGPGLSGLMDSLAPTDIPSDREVGPNSATFPGFYPEGVTSDADTVIRSDPRVGPSIIGGNSVEEDKDDPTVELNLPDRIPTSVGAPVLVDDPSGGVVNALTEKTGDTRYTWAMILFGLALLLAVLLGPKVLS